MQFEFSYNQIVISPQMLNCGRYCTKYVDIYIDSVNQTTVCTHRGNYLFIRPWDHNSLGKCWNPNTDDSELTNMCKIIQINTKMYNNKTNKVTFF